MDPCDSLNQEQWAQWWRKRGFTELRQILFRRWDPIGVADAFPVTEDEYDDYVRALGSRLRAGVTGSEIAEYLFGVERDEMGLSEGSLDQLQSLGRRVLEWYETSTSRWGEGTE